MMIAFGNLNGAVTSNVYRGQDKPWFSLGHGIILMYISIGLIATLVYKFFLTRENQKRERGERTEIIRGVNDGFARDRVSVTLVIVKISADAMLLKSPSPKQGLFQVSFKQEDRVYDSLEEVKREKGDEWSGYRYIT
jgi:plastocyanin domain-containing protein